ncbi:MAG: DUF6524 family protein [Gammaproteobacteria bacterium]|nr:DUF6524 family protein [Gammaproteobacteria bacterium]
MSEEKSKHGQIQLFGWVDFLLRFLMALTLVLFSYNPTDYCYLSWVMEAWKAGSAGPEHLFVGVLFVIGWSIFLVATFNSLGLTGLILGAVFFASLIWMLVDFGVLAASSMTAVTWIALICLSALLAIGISWSHVWRRLTGQLVVDEIEQ